MSMRATHTQSNEDTHDVVPDLLSCRNVITVGLSFLLVPNTTAIAAYTTVTVSLHRKQALCIVFASKYKVNYGVGHMDDCPRD